MEFRKRPLLFLVLGAIVFVILNFSGFLDNVVFYAGGQAATWVIQNQWPLVFVNIGLFLLFLVPLYYRKKANWKHAGLFSAFIISLFIEMYGFPLSIYLASHAFNAVPEPRMHTILFFLNFGGVDLGFDFWMTYGTILILIGIFLILAGWIQLFRSKKELYTGGIYRYSRHPQYLGFFFLIWGWVIAWPSLLTLILAPILTWAYYSAAKAEEKELAQKIGKPFLEYQKTVPMFG